MIPSELVKPAHELIQMMTDAEKRWTKYISNVNGDWLNEISAIDPTHRGSTLKGFSNETIDIFVENQANSVCSNLGFPLLFEGKENVYNPLGILLKNHLSYAREGVFEIKGKEYNGRGDLGF